jgi:hypothetical protein
MERKFDIFRKLPDGQSLWIKAVEGLEQAEQQLLRAKETSPGEYFIFNPRNGSVVPPMSLSASA